MCKHGTVRMVEQSRLPGKEYRHDDPIELDECIADIVLALNEGGVPTTSSCCGHGTAPGHISLRGDRHLLVIDPLYMAWSSIEMIRSNLKQDAEGA